MESKISWILILKIKGKARGRIHQKSTAKMKTKVKQLTSRSNGISKEDRVLKLRRYIMGWVKNDTVRALGFISFSHFYRQVTV